MPPLPRGIHRRTFFEVDESLVARFWKRTHRKSDDECWPWLGANRNGYGAIRQFEKVLSAHVVSFVIHGGELSDGLLVTHSCDNRICVNPSHLVSGTPTTNAREMFQRRTIPVARGVELHNAQLNDDLVRAIRAYSTSGHGHGVADTARHFGVSFHAVKGVLSGKNWKHVN